MIEHMEGTPEKLGDVLRDIRKRQGLKAKELANRLGSSPAAISQWENNSRKPRDNGTLLRIIYVLDPQPSEMARLSQALGSGVFSNSGLIEDSKDLPTIISLLENRINRTNILLGIVKEQVEEIQGLVNQLRSSTGRIDHLHDFR